MVRIDAMGDPRFGQLIEDRRCAHDSPPIINISFLEPIEVRHESRTDAAFELRPHPQEVAPQFLDQFSKNAAVENQIRKETEVPNRLEG